MPGLAKAIRISVELRQDWHAAIHAYLRSYRDAPHTAAGVAPSMLMFGRSRSSRLPNVAHSLNKTEMDQLMAEARVKDEQSKISSKIYTDGRRRARNRPLSFGDRVFGREKRSGKWISLFSRED